MNTLDLDANAGQLPAPRHISNVKLTGFAVCRPTIEIPGSIPFACIHLAIRHLVEDPAREGQERSRWHRIIAFKGLGEIVLGLKVGNQIAVRGRLQSAVYEYGGNRLTYTEIVADQIEFLAKHAPLEVHLAREQSLFLRTRRDPNPIAGELAALFCRGCLLET